MTQIVLASGSAARQKMLRDANIPITAVSANIDEAAIKAAMRAEHRPAGEIAQALATAKATAVAKTKPGHLVIGCDQILEHQGRIFSKPKTRDDAARQLRALFGSGHRLISAVSIVESENVLWHHRAEVRLSMRALSDQYISAYLDRNWPAISDAVGAYHLEGEGARLFSVVDGDYFTVLGLPLIPLVSWLTERGVLDT